MDNYCEAVKVFCSTNYQLKFKWIFTMCSAKGSAHVPFQKNLVVYFFTRVWCWNQLAEIWGVQNSVILSFPSTLPGNAIASSHLLPLYSSTPSSSQRYSYKPSSESENSVEYFRWPRAAVHALISLYKERQLKNYYSDWQRFFNYGHLTGRFAQTLGRRGLMWSNYGAEITSGSSTIC